ncbi:MscS Mechanosensitive ion channel [Striga asiatica]|uniref:MscS Mechanosensitive ion channel n=1 Tax=Striga asiatica TaxID=4170 RepID=A0A5A7QPI1_STRAF|nr:MscS Mechanosensitive ion channel [Striga asiatica]
MDCKNTNSTKREVDEAECSQQPVEKVQPVPVEVISPQPTMSSSPEQTLFTKETKRELSPTAVNISERPKIRYCGDIHKMDSFEGEFLRLCSINAAVAIEKAIPMSFWREHIEHQVNDTTRAILLCKGGRYIVPINQAHGKALMEHGDAREFMDHSGIVEGITCVFILIGYECVVFKVRLLDG